ncbi:hypothetical protein EJB05_53279, partial [Eragrostis curvula]
MVLVKEEARRRVEGENEGGGGQEPLLLNRPDYKGRSRSASEEGTHTVVKNRVICDKIAGKFYLTMEEYIEQRPMWCKEACWSVLAAEWSNSDFQKRSERNRANRNSCIFKPHKGGSNSIATIRQKLAKERGRDVSEVEAWIYSHRGPNPEDLDSLNTEEATACLERYKAKAIELNGSDFDWLHSPVDVKALYECCYGRQHGKWAIFNGVIDDREALAELKSGRLINGC